ncbi:MAG: hypothetical protein K2G89_07210 [Lachnospiraceae bacterium]|nr:hypothetical protein [Lachnospiraceae bacterium]
MGLYLFPSIFVLLLVIKHIIAKSGSEDKASKTLLELEAEANNTRKQDVSQLPYIQVPVDTLPFHTLTPSPAVEADIINLAKKQILNLNGITNTALKKQYGPANLDFLSRCDENYTTLIRNLTVWAKSFYEANMYAQARTILEYSVSIGSDIRQAYQMLTDIYAREQDMSALKNLRQQAEKLTSLSAPDILGYIDSHLK